MSQIAHRHLLLVYGVSVHGAKSELKPSCMIALTVFVCWLFASKPSKAECCVAECCAISVSTDTSSCNFKADSYFVNFVL